jgi:hypothetical protein
MPAAFGQVDFAANDRLNVALFCFIGEILGREKIAVVRDRYGRHLLARCFVQELGSFASPVKQAEIRVNVKMYELRLAHGTQF